MKKLLFTIVIGDYSGANPKLQLTPESNMAENA